ncbi:nucleotide sugar dehydrogenase [Blastococcus sp. BMG 814]|uniref:Nucleotide sugar dehydrogenase n=1 Tax=Blastococcus carthaginiensis TaxID=3050034 RepID=A0ABT9IFC7_9ACTN|nr:nucleotide sugar dehydrogenase [Blastococcus carthaginiensis]MDP5183834.1 nucleotide sugar dehydrogenase [Blastococcus carthaginiensis]
MILAVVVNSARATRAVVVGLGYVGLPLVVEMVRRGHQVIGLDRDEAIIANLRSGRSHIDDIDDATIEEILGAGFLPTSDASCIAEADAVIVCVPTPLSKDGGPDLGAVESVGRVLGERLTSDTLVVLESTTYPGTTEEFFQPLVEARGLRVGAGLSLAFSPERVDPGNPVYGIKNTPKVVGGVTPECTDRAVAFYSSFIDTVVAAKGTREAEMAKLLENTYRHINIALVNEMARFSHELGIDLWNVIDCAKTKPFGFQAFYPGPGVGGHCIPIDPNYLSHTVQARLHYPFRFVELAQEVNAGMPNYVARRIQDRLNDEGKAVRGSTVLLLGVTYKANIADERESPAVPLALKLEAMGADVRFHDPHVDVWNAAAHGDPERLLEGEQDLHAALKQADIVVLLQAHHEYLDGALDGVGVFDTRGVLSGSEVVRL